MWCPQCKKKSPAVAVGNDELICAQCRTEIVPTIPKPKSRVARRASNGSGRKKLTTSQSASTATSSKPDQNVASTQAVIKSWTDSNRKWRADKAHLTRPSEEVATPSGTEPSEHAPIPLREAQSSSRHNLILFGLFVFLAGHGLTIWAFLAAHFGAWTIGSFCSVGGISIAMISVVQALRDLEKRLTESDSTRNRSTKKVLRGKRKKTRRQN